MSKISLKYRLYRFSEVHENPKIGFYLFYFYFFLLFAWQEF